MYVAGTTFTVMGSVGFVFQVACYKTLLKYLGLRKAYTSY